MAKIYGINGVITGKLGAAVYAVRNGEQISRQYQPIVANPSTPEQVKVRAKMKLMSQLGAVVGPFIAIPRVGAVSSRNLFTKVNYPMVNYADDAASINLSTLQLTKSVVALPLVQAERAENRISVNLQPNGDVSAFSRIVYVALDKQSDQKLRVIGSFVSNAIGTNEQKPWPGVFASTNDEVVILAYGVRDNTENARTVFGNLQVVTAEQVAKLVVTSTLLANDITLTETRGITLAAVA
jgi:hypothetical protein